MNAINLSTPARPESNQDDYERAICVTIARCIATALILITIGLTEWYGSAVYGNPLISSQEEFTAADRGPSDAYFPAQYVN